MLTHAELLQKSVDLSVSLATAAAALHAIKDGKLNFEEQENLANQTLEAIGFADKDFLMRFSIASIVAFDSLNNKV